MSAITWRNITGRSLSEASAPMEAAQRSIQNAFSNAESMLNRYDQDQKRAKEEADAAAVLGFREQLAAARSPEEIEALRAERDALAPTLGNEQRGSLIGSINKSLDDYYRRDALTQERQDAQLKREQQPLVDQIRTLMVNDPEAAKELLAANPGLLSAPDLAADIKRTARGDIEWANKLDNQKWTNTKRQWETEDRPGQVAKNMVNDAESVYKYQQMINSQVQAVESAYVKPTLEDVDTRNGLIGRLAEISDAPREVRENLSKVLANPKYAGISADRVYNLLANDTDSSGLYQWLNPKSWEASGNTTKILDRYLESPEHKSDLAQRESQRSSALAQIQDQQSVMEPFLNNQMQTIARRAEPSGTSNSAPRQGNGDYNFTGKESMQGQWTSGSQDYNGMVRALESGTLGDRAKAKGTSASGRDQMTERTWNTLVKRTKPAWAEGMSPEQILEARFNPVYSKEIREAQDQEHAQMMQRKGIPVTNENMYAMHHLGARDGLKLLSAPDNSLVSNHVSADAVAKNKYLKGKTKAEVFSVWRSKYSKFRNAIGINNPAPTPAEASASIRGSSGASNAGSGNMVIDMNPPPNDTPYSTSLPGEKPSVADRATVVANNATTLDKAASKAVKKSDKPESVQKHEAAQDEVKAARRELAKFGARARNEEPELFRKAKLRLEKAKEKERELKEAADKDWEEQLRKSNPEVFKPYSPYAVKTNRS